MNHNFTGLCCGPGYLWFRVRGYGLRVANRRQHKALFSERMGVVKHLQLGSYSIVWLKP